MPGCPAPGCDHRNFPRHHGEQFLPRRIEQSFRAEASFQLLELQEQITRSIRTQAHRTQLALSVFRVYIRKSADQDPVSVPGFDPGVESVLPEHHAADCGFFILQGEIPVPCGKVRPESAYFTAYSDASDAWFSPYRFSKQVIQLGYADTSRFTHVSGSFQLRRQCLPAAWQSSSFRRRRAPV